MPLTPPAPPSLRQRIGGRWAISPWLFAVSAVLVAIPAVAPVTGLVATPLSQGGPVLPSLLCEIAGIGLLLVIANLTLFRNRAQHPVPVWWVFALGVTGGLVRLAAQVAVAGGISAHPAGVATTILGVLSVLAAGSLVPPLIAYLVATREWYAQARERLIARAAEAEAERLRAVGSLREVTLTAVQDDLEQARAVLSRDGAQPDDVATALLAAARGGVRPAAHSLLDRTPAQAPRVSLGAVLTSELHRTPLPILVPAVGLAVLIAPRALAAMGSAAAVLVPILGVLGILGVFPLARRLIRRHTRWALPLVAAACAVAIAPAAALLAWGLPARAPAAVYLAMAFLLFLLVLVTGIVATAEQLGEEVLGELGAPIREAEVERMAADRARDLLLREIALHLHGSVQSGLVSASYAIRDALDSGDDAALDAAMARAHAVLNQDLLQPSPGHALADDHHLLQAMAREWEGLLDVEWHVDGVDRVPPAMWDIVRECLSNAVVHGRARHATVWLQRDGDALVLDVEDDGCGPQGGPAGMGSSVLERGSQGSWSLGTAPGGGTRVHARVPLGAIVPT